MGAVGACSGMGLFWDGWLPAILYVADLIEFAQQFCHRRQIEVAFQQRWHWAKQLVGLVQQAPDLADHCRAMGIDQQVVGLVVMAGHMHIGHPLAGQGGPAVVAAGIAEALVATAAGMAVAIPAVVFFNYYMRKVAVLNSSMEAASLRISAYLGLK